MSRSFWSSRTSAPLDNCDTIEPLLSLAADGGASPEETQRLDAHLRGCAGCRAVLSGIQATRTALASRPVALPPPDLRSRITIAIALSSRSVAAPPPHLHSRIALAIAASSAAPIPLRPARVFTRRAAYAAAASLTALGIALSSPLWHTPGGVAVKHSVKSPVLAAAPPIKTPAAMKAPTRPLVASSSVKPAVKHSVLARKTVPAAVTAPEHIAAVTPLTKLPVVPQVVKALVHHAPTTEKIASAHAAPTETHSIEKHSPLPVVKTPVPKLMEGPQVARVIKEPIRVPLNIQAPKLTPDSPPVRVASTHEALSLRSDNILKSVVAHTEDMRKASLKAISVPVGSTAREAMSLPHVLGGDDRTAFISAVHGNQ